MLIYGKQPIHYALAHHKEKIQTLFLAKEVEKKEYSALMKMGLEVKRIPENVAQSMARGGNHQGYLAQMDDLQWHDLSAIRRCSFVVVLYNVTDVGNIGSLIRSAYALGVDALIITGIKNPKLEPIVRASSGAALDLPLIHVSNPYDLLNPLKQEGFALYGAAMDGESLHTITWGTKRALILGSEGEGLSGRLKKGLDVHVSIPMAHHFDSLNVSVAGAILMERMR